MPEMTAADLVAMRERLATEIKEFCDVYAGEYARDVSWRWTSGDPEDFEAEVVLKLYDGSARRVPLRFDNDSAMGIDVGDAGMLPMDAAGLYLYLWVEDADDLRKTREALAEERVYNENLREHNMRMLVALAAALYDQESDECSLEFKEQTADVQKAYIDMAFAKAREYEGAGANPVSAGAGADGGSTPEGGGPKTACPPGHF